MKIGILTLPLHTNYGGNIQAYALMTVLKKAGHDVWLINRQTNETASWKIPILILKRIAVNLFKTTKSEILVENKRKKTNKIIKKQTQLFINEYITPQTKALTSSKNIKKDISIYGFDAIIVGSDQVWRPAYTPNILDYFLNFWDADNGKRISYAASFGTDSWEFTDLETKTCSDNLKKFTAVSVREKAAVDMCKKHFGQIATHVLDPTMLLDSTDYLNVINSNRTKVKKGLLVYILDQAEDKTKAINFLSASLKLDIFTTHHGIDADHAISVAPPMDNWLAGFRDAEFVITDSFHACVFSILFEKPFFVYGNEGRGMVRFTSLLEMFGLMGRLVSATNPLTVERINENIDWKKVKTILKEQRELSINFLTESLS